MEDPPPPWTTERSEIPVPVSRPGRNLDITELAPYLTPEILKRVLVRPDYFGVICQYAPILAEQLEQDPEAQQALQDLLEQEERLPPLVAAGLVAAGMVAGWFAER